MPLSIKNDALERLARRLADETGESLTSTILISLEERWERIQSRRRASAARVHIDELLRRLDALPAIDSRPPDEILGYDEHGLPR